MATEAMAIARLKVLWPQMLLATNLFALHTVFTNHRVANCVTSRTQKSALIAVFWTEAQQPPP